MTIPVGEGKKGLGKHEPQDGLSLGLGPFFHRWITGSRDSCGAENTTKKQLVFLMLPAKKRSLCLSRGSTESHNTLLRLGIPKELQLTSKVQMLCVGPQLLEPQSPPPLLRLSFTLQAYHLQASLIQSCKHSNVSCTTTQASNTRTSESTTTTSSLLLPHQCLWYNPCRFQVLRAQSLTHCTL